MHSVVIHKYDDTHTAIEFGKESDSPENFLVFIGGLGDGFLTVPYVPRLAGGVSKQLGGSWVVVQALISSSYLGFGTGSLKRDTQELGRLVKYLRTKRGTENSKVVLMGHSTGCQDTLEYLSKYTKKDSFDVLLDLDGGILQAPVSDAEAFRTFESGKKLDELLELSKRHIEEGNPFEILPKSALKFSFGAPITAYRFASLASERGDDDYFSSYLTSEELLKSFGVVTKPLLVLFGEKDEFVPDFVDRQKLVDGWKKSTDPNKWSPLSKVLKGATHNVGPQSDKGAEEDLINTVISFIKDQFSN